MSVQVKRITVPIAVVAAIAAHSWLAAWWLSSKFHSLETKVNTAVFSETWGKPEMSDWAQDFQRLNRDLRVPSVRYYPTPSEE